MGTHNVVADNLYSFATAECRWMKRLTFAISLMKQSQEQMSIVLHDAHGEAYTDTPLKQRTNNRVRNVINSMRNRKMAQTLRHRAKKYACNCLETIRYAPLPLPQRKNIHLFG